jgi:hypothetical protein
VATVKVKDLTAMPEWAGVSVWGWPLHFLIYNASLPKRQHNGRFTSEAAASGVAAVKDLTGRCPRQRRN